jgi:hypothetical protein
MFQLPLLTSAAPPESGDGYIDFALVVIGILIAIFVPRILRRRRGGSGETPFEGSGKPVREQYEEGRRRLEARKSADKILVEVVETGREVSAQLDTRIRVLNTLIRDAERCIRRLEELTPDSPPAHGPVDSAQPAKAVVSVTDDEGSSAGFSPTAGEESPEPERRKDASAPDVPPGGEEERRQVTTDVPHKLGSHAPAGDGASVESPDMDAKARAVRMHAEGWSVPEIAREIGLSRREVSLILHLHAKSPL